MITWHSVCVGKPTTKKNPPKKQQKKAISKCFKCFKRSLSLTCCYSLEYMTHWRVGLFSCQRTLLTFVRQAPAQGRMGNSKHLISNQQQPIHTVLWGYSSQGAGLHLCWISEVPFSWYLQSEVPLFTALLPSNVSTAPPSSALSTDSLSVPSTPLGH